MLLLLLLLLLFIVVLIVVIIMIVLVITTTTTTTTTTIIIVIIMIIIIIIVVIIVVVVTGVQGLCLGILLGAAATDASFYFLVWHTDWSLEADKAAERVGVKTLSGSADVSIASLSMQEMTDSSEQQSAEAETARLLAGH